MPIKVEISLESLKLLRFIASQYYEAGNIFTPKMEAAYQEASKLIFDNEMISVNGDVPVTAKQRFQQASKELDGTFGKIFRGELYAML